MEEGKKKMIMIVVIVACLVAAGIITYSTTYSTRSGGIGVTTAVWLKCRNTDCEHEWQMNKGDYAAYVREHLGSTRVQPAITCPKCGEESGYPVEE